MILIAPLPVLIIAGVVGIAVIVSNKNNSTTSSSVLSDTTTAGGSTALDTSKQPVMLPLGGADQSSKPDPNALHVNNQPSSGRSLQQNQLGSGQGQQQQSNTGSTSGSGTQVPGPDTFEQYLQYKSQAHSLMGDIQVGTGAELKTGMKAAVLYKGWLTSGELFDESTEPCSGCS